VITTIFAPASASGSRISRKRERFDFPSTSEALKRGRHQHEVNEQTGAERDEQKYAKTTEPAICCHDGTKLPKNRPAHKRFSRSRVSLRR
jgi:hypothetical protein